jgi:geranylgeranyl diphosphate synthase type I
LELFHSFALIHDDVMDASDTRRGRPTMHRLVAARHRGHQAADLLGVNVAILLGDLALGWSYDLVHAAALDSTQAATVWPLLDAMRIETMTGQYLDLLATGTSPGSVEDALAIVRYKTAKYTVEYPLRLGAHLAGATTCWVPAPPTAFLSGRHSSCVMTCLASSATLRKRASPR